MNPSPLGDRSASSPPFGVRLTFHGDLAFFLRPRMEGGLRRGAYGAERASGTPKLTGLAGARPSTIERTVERVLKERTSVKDVIEACGVPHSEVDAIIIDGTPADFARVLQRNGAVEIYPVDLTHESLCHALLQERHVTRFVADGHLGKLTRNLRLLGFDVVSPTPADDRQLLETMQRENRALLTRDRRLLMHAVVRNGFYPRSQDANEQTVEVLRRFEIFSLMAPFTRCSQCNGLLEEVAKEKIIENLEPLTRIYYDQFRRCQNCGKIYWRGSHFDKLCARIEEFRAKSAT